MDSNQILSQARAVIQAEAEAVAKMADYLDDDFTTAVSMLSGCNRQILVTGAGTSGAIARRMAHLLATCGMPAFYVHPGEGLHGPSAAIAAGDVIVALSKAGRSQELNQYVKVGRERGAKVIAMTWQPDSELGQLSDVVLNVHSGQAGEGEGILPFGSTLAAGAMADALVLAAKQERGFDLATLTQTHPSGATADLVRKGK